MSAPPPPRPHRRAARQLLLGLVPVLVVGLLVLLVLGLRLPGRQAPLAAAVGTAQATVTADGGSPDGRGLTVTFPDASGTQRTGRVELTRRLEVAAGTSVTVRYDPDDVDDEPVLVHIDGDAAHAAVTDLVFGLVAVVTVLLVVVGLTGARLLGRPRLRRAAATPVRATHVVSRQGLLVRSRLELATPTGVRWLPVYWAPELDRMAPDTPIEVRGNPGRDRLVLPVVAGAEIWPSGRLQRRAPRGDLRQAAVDPAAGDLGLGRQARADGVLPFAAPLLGLLWAYLDSSGVGGFLVATALSAAVLFWLPQLLGSDPRASSRG